MCPPALPSPPPPTSPTAPHPRLGLAGGKEATAWESHVRPKVLKTRGPQRDRGCSSLPQCGNPAGNTSWPVLPCMRDKGKRQERRTGVKDRGGGQGRRAGPVHFKSPVPIGWHTHMHTLTHTFTHAQGKGSESSVVQLLPILHSLCSDLRSTR